MANIIRAAGNLFATASSSSYSVFILCCPLGRNGQIYPIPSAFAQIPALHLARLRASSFFKPIFCLLDHLLLPGLLHRPCFLLPLTSRSRATLKILSSTLLSTCPYHQLHLLLLTSLLFPSTPTRHIYSSVVFLSTTF